MCELTDEECERLKEDLSFARLFTGSFLGQGRVGNREPFNIIGTFTADGNVVFDTALQFGAAGPAAAFKSTFRGSWTRSGERKVVLTIVQFDYDASGVNNAIVRTSFTVEIDEAFEELTAEGFTAVFSPDLDPFREDPDIALDVPSAFTARRIPPGTR